MELAQIALVVRDYDEAIAWYSRCLGFVLSEDIDLGEGKRWVVMAPPASKGARILLARAAKPEQETRIGNQTGGRVFLFLHTDNFARDYEMMKTKGVRFVREPAKQPYGTVVVFEDLYGNLWDFVEPTK